MSESDEEIVVIGYCLASYAKKLHKTRKRKRSVWVVEWLQKRVKYGAYHGLLRELDATDSMSYKNFLRMDRAAFEFLAEKVAPVIARQDTRLRQAITVEDRLAVTLRFLATGL